MQPKVMQSNPLPRLDDTNEPKVDDFQPYHCQRWNSCWLYHHWMTNHHRTLMMNLSQMWCLMQLTPPKHCHHKSRMQLPCASSLVTTSLALAPRNSLRPGNTAAAHAEATWAAGQLSESRVSCFSMRCMRKLSQDIKLRVRLSCSAFFLSHLSPTVANGPPCTFAGSMWT